MYVLKKIGVLTQVEKTDSETVYAFSNKFVESATGWYKLQRINPDNLLVEEIRKGDSVDERLKSPENFAEQLLFLQIPRMNI